MVDSDLRRGIIVGCIENSEDTITEYAQAEFGITSLLKMPKRTTRTIATFGIGQQLKDRMRAEALDTDADAVFVVAHAACSKAGISDIAQQSYTQRAADMVRNNLFPYSAPVVGIFFAKERIGASTIYVAHKVNPPSVTIRRPTRKS